MISSTTSEQWHSKQSQSEELISPFSLKKEPQKCIHFCLYYVLYSKNS